MYIYMHMYIYIDMYFIISSPVCTSMAPCLSKAPAEICTGPIAFLRAECPRLRPHAAG